MQGKDHELQSLLLFKLVCIKLYILRCFIMISTALNKAQQPQFAYMRGKEMSDSQSTKV
jgi:hypothetical protein